MKKIIILLAMVMLSGCFGSSNGEIVNENMTSLSRNTFSISYPQDWKIIEKEDLHQKAPSDTVLVIRSNQVHKGEYPNFSVVEEKISENLSATEFAEINIGKAPSVIYNLQTVKKENIEINGQKTIFFDFIGRKSEEEKDLEYYQIYYTKNDKGITITAAFSPDSDTSVKDLLQSALKSYRFKD